MRVTISSSVKTESGTSKAGKAFTERFQEAFLHDGKQYPTSCKVSLFDGAREYAVGDYDTKQDVEISDFGRLQVKRDLVLSPASAKS